MSTTANPTSQPALSAELDAIRDQLVDWMSVMRVPESPTAKSWFDYIEPMHCQPWRESGDEPDALKINLFTGENRYLLLVRPEGDEYSLTVYCLARQPFKDEVPFNEDSFISGGDFSVETLYGCLFAILERELIGKV